MQIIYYGGSCFKIISNELNILIDPFSPQNYGFKNPRLTSEIVLFSDPSFLKKKEGEKSDIFFINTPGEYEIKNVFIVGFPVFEKNNLKTIYKIESEEIKVCFLNEFFKQLVFEEFKKIGETDILLFPLFPSQSFKEITKIIKELQPKIIISYFLEEKSKEKIIDKFAKEIGWKKIERMPKLKIKKKDLSLEKKELIILEPTINY